MRFFGHADAGAETVTKLLRRLRFSTREVAFVSTLVKEHLRPVQLAQVGEAPTRRAIYRFYRALGDAAPAVLLLALADAAAARGAKMTREGWSRQAAYMNSLLVRSQGDAGIVDQPRLLDGNDIMRELGMPAGPAIGTLLEALQEAQAAGEVTDVEGARDFIVALKDIAGGPNATTYRRLTGQRLVIVFLGVALALSAYWYPIVTAMNVPYEFWHMHMWLPSWI